MEKRNRAQTDEVAQKMRESSEQTRQSSGLRYENLVASLFFGKDADQQGGSDSGVTTTDKKR
jgi:hypothetical protein